MILAMIAGGSTPEQVVIGLGVSMIDVESAIEMDLERRAAIDAYYASRRKTFAYPSRA